MLTCIIRAMGRLRIKKKEAVLPFRQTVAYRFIIIATLLIVFLYGVIRAITALGSADTTGLIIAIALAVGAAGGAFYNLEKMRYARIPKKTAMRIKRL